MLDLSTSTRVIFDTFSNHGVSNVEFAFLHEAFTRYPGNNFTYPLHSAGCIVQMSGSADDIRFINDNSQERNQDIYATIRYTKTTD